MLAFLMSPYYIRDTLAGMENYCIMIIMEQDAGAGCRLGKEHIAAEYVRCLDGKESNRYIICKRACVNLIRESCRRSSFRPKSLVTMQQAEKGWEDLEARALENSTTVVYNTSRLMEIFGYKKNKALALMHSDSFPLFRIGKKYYVEEQRLCQ